MEVKAMARFIGSDSVQINVDFIVEVQKISEEMLKVTLKNGKTVHIPAFFSTIFPVTVPFVRQSR